ncbi:hypothetical protein AB0F52_38520 [Amycolatopsis sp. NPDC024027]|uniref:hypothetical protein n=1 Tax=Amycolatopsis sp. NPDC024027 TaxID=3154327 RepID=UPI0033FAFD65
MMRRIVIAAAFALSLLVMPATGAHASAAPGGGHATPSAASAASVEFGGELWEYSHTFEFLSTCKFTGRIGVITKEWLDYKCKWDDYRDGYSLWVRVF